MGQLKFDIAQIHWGRAERSGVGSVDYFRFFVGSDPLDVGMAFS